MLIEALGVSAIFVLGVLPKLLSGDQQQVLDSSFPRSTFHRSTSTDQTPSRSFSAIARLRGGLPELKVINNLLSLQADSPMFNSLNDLLKVYFL